MGRLAIGMLLVAAGLLLLGCVEQFTGKDKVREQCATQLTACQKQCDDQGYILGSTVEQCKTRCSADYNTCLTR